jgi:hypothetical protein
MNTIGGLTTILHRLRAGQGNSQKKATGKSASHPRPAACTGEGEMRPLLAARLAVLDLSKPDMQERAVDLFIETALYREFGAAVLEQESLQDLLVQVREAMLCTPAGRNAVLEMLRAVRRSSKQ